MGGQDRGGSGDDLRLQLRADCERCVGLCCVAPAFSVSADFAIDKPAGTPCVNLTPDFRCGIHAHLRTQGFAGCTAYDCFGAGQQVSQVTFSGRDWRRHPDIAAQMFDVFGIMRELHELLWYLTEALALPRAAQLDPELRGLRAEVLELTRQSPDALAGLDRTAVRGRGSVLLRHASELTRGATPASRDFTGRDLTGRDLRGKDWRGVLLLGTRLLGADLGGANLAGSDLRAADLRGADLTNADLTGCIFLIQAQVEGARGNRGTRLPDSVSHPVHWVRG